MEGRWGGEEKKRGGRGSLFGTHPRGENTMKVLRSSPKPESAQQYLIPTIDENKGTSPSPSYQHVPNKYNGKHTSATVLPGTVSIAVNDAGAAVALLLDPTTADFACVVSKARPIRPRCVNIWMEAEGSLRDGIGLTVTRRHPSSAGRTPIKNRGMIHAGAAVHGCENVPPPPGANGCETTLRASMQRASA